MSPDEEKYFISMTRLEEKTHAARIIQQGPEMDPQKDCDSDPMGGEVARKVTGGQATPCGAFASGNQRQEKKKEILREMQSTMKAEEK